MRLQLSRDWLLVLLSFPSFMSWMYHPKFVLDFVLVAKSQKSAKAQFQNHQPEKKKKTDFTVHIWMYPKFGLKFC